MKIQGPSKPVLIVDVTVKCPICKRRLNWPPRVRKVKCPCGAELRRK